MPGCGWGRPWVGASAGRTASGASLWRVSDSLSLRHFLGLGLAKSESDHSTLSRTRRLLDLEVHQHVFTWVLGVLASNGLLKGKTIGVDATTLEANAALRSLVRRDDGRSRRHLAHGGNVHDTKSVGATLDATATNLVETRENLARERGDDDDDPD